MQHYGMILVLSSPSGAGKSTLGRMLRADKAMNLGLSVSVTTRLRRPSEREGVDYYFVSKDEFKHMVAANAFVEWAEVHGAYYGTLQKTIDKVLRDGCDIVFDIDYQGAGQIRKKRPRDVVSVFILPPSMQELQQRLLGRSENSAADIELRLHNAVKEMRKWKSYDYILVNDDVQQSFLSLKAIITAERLKRHRLPAMKDFVDSLIAKA